MSLVVKQTSLMMTVQDQGRFGFLRFGLPESGPMDPWAFCAANRLVDNAPGRACLEMGYSKAVLLIEQDVLLAVCGTGYRAFLNGRQIPLWMAFWAQAGEQLDLEKTDGGNWVYLSAAGGIQSTRWMGSRCVNLQAGLGRVAVEGDHIPLDTGIYQNRWRAGMSYPKGYQPNYASAVSIGVVPGPHVDRFTPESLANFWHQPYQVTNRSNRMGYRLSGSRLTTQGGSDVISQGMVIGQIQVPTDGQPIVMMPDHPTTGGYISIGTVCRVDLPLIAQAQPENTQIRFIKITEREAIEKLSIVYDTLEKIEKPQEDLWMNL